MLGNASNLLAMLPASLYVVCDLKMGVIEMQSFYLSCGQRGNSWTQWLSSYSCYSILRKRFKVSRFMKYYNQITFPLTKLTSPTRIFPCSPEADQVFPRLKELFSTTPIPTHPNTSKQCTVQVDSADTSAGAVPCSQCDIVYTPYQFPVIPGHT